MPSLALVVEGIFDVHAYSPLIHRENKVVVDIVPRPCGGPVSGKFVRTLRTLSYLQPTIDKAVVVADAHGKDRVAYKRDLEDQIRNLDFPFPVEIVIVVPELEAILLCDPRAIEAVCAERGSAVALPNLTHNPEGLTDPKAELERKLRQGELVYVPTVAEAIATRARLDSLAYWSQSYRDLRSATRLGEPSPGVGDAV